MNIKNSILLRVRVVFLLIFVFALVVALKIAKIQWIEGDKWIRMSQKIGLQYKPLKATRGNIYSDNGSLLATSLPFYRLAFDPVVADRSLYRKEIDSLSLLLSRHFGDRSAAAYKQRIQDARLSGKRYLVLNREKIGHMNKKKMEQWPLLRAGRYRGGVIFEQVDERYKPFGYLGARSIGFVNDNHRGAGLEYSFDRYLTGKEGKGLYQKMAGGHWKPVYNATEIKPEEGLDIETTLDVNLQDVTQSSLLSALLEHKADFGCAVVMEVQTGQIKAMSNLTRRKDGRYAEIYNYAVGGLTEPGSTFKLASVIALFEDTNLSLQDSVATGNGVHHFYDRVMPDYKVGGFGTITVREAFAYSSNIAISSLVDHHFGLKPERYIDYLQGMGLANRSGFQLAGEGDPYIPTPEDKSWSGVALPWMAIGYGLKLTPLQTLTFYNAVANQGKMIQPIIVKKIKKADQVVESFQPVVLNKKICSDETLRKVRILLESVVEEGTARNIKNDYYKIAGKTGTAKKLVDGEYTKTYYTSFAGYFPADRPKYSCIVVIDHPKGYQQYGSDVAAPVFKNIADKIYATDLDIHDPLPREFARDSTALPLIQAGNYEDLQRICKTLQIENQAEETAEWVRAEPDQHSIRWEEDQGTASLQYVPDVRGMSLRDALFLLENRGLEVEYKGSGRIEEQSQEAGSEAVKGSRILLTLG